MPPPRRRPQQPQQHQQPVPSFAGSVDQGSAAMGGANSGHHNQHGASSALAAVAPTPTPHSSSLPWPLPPMPPLPSAPPRRHGTRRGADLSGLARLVALELPMVAAEEPLAAGSPAPQPPQPRPSPRLDPASASPPGGGGGGAAARRPPPRHPASAAAAAAEPCRTNLSGDVILVSCELSGGGGAGAGREADAAADAAVTGRPATKANNDNHNNNNHQNAAPPRPSYRHGNYPFYYGYRLGRGWLAEHHRSPDEFDDPRLAALALACPAPATAAEGGSGGADAPPPRACAWLKGARVLDIGCNEGLVTLAIAAQHGARSVKGVDLDAGLVRRARGHLAAARRAAGQRYGALCARARVGRCGDPAAALLAAPGDEEREDDREAVETSGSGEDEDGDAGARAGEEQARPPSSAADAADAAPIPASLAAARTLAALRRRVRALSRVRFAVADWPGPAPPAPRRRPRGGRCSAEAAAAASPSSAAAAAAADGPRAEAGRYDAVTCLSVTKWVHLNGGDAALLRLFARARRALCDGGLLVLEPQPWRSYRSASRKLHGFGGGGSSGAGGGALSSLKLRPEAFVDLLCGERFGFELVATVRPRVAGAAAAGEGREEGEEGAAAAGTAAAAPAGDAEVAAAALRGRGFSDRPVHVLRKLPQAPPPASSAPEDEEDDEEAEDDEGDDDDE